jgi:hypothetical protein
MLIVLKAKHYGPNMNFLPTSKPIEFGM